MKKAIVLLSGGMDSAVCLYWAKSKGYECHCLTFDYGQRHKKEITYAKKIARISEEQHYILNLNFPWKGSALLDRSILIPFSKTVDQNKIPVTYVPARNMIFLSIAASFAETIGAEAIIIGANAVDFSGYPDCRPVFYKAFSKVIESGTKRGSEGKKINILTPLINLSKKGIIKLGRKLKVPIEETWSCYSGGKTPCGKCDACVLRNKGFAK